MIPFTLLGGGLRMAGLRPPEDALWLAASLPALPPGSRILDAAAGSGVAGLAVLLRQPQAQVTAVELQPQLAAQANANATLNGFANYTCAAGDILDFKNQGPFDAVLCNPPFHAAARGHSSPRAGTQLAHHLPAGLLENWLAHFCTLTSGPIHLLLHTDNQAELESAATRLGLAARLTPLATHATRPPKRMLAVLTRQSEPNWQINNPLPVYDKGLREAVLERGEGLPAGKL